MESNVTISEMLTSGEASIVSFDSVSARSSSMMLSVSCLYASLSFLVKGAANSSSLDSTNEQARRGSDLDIRAEVLSDLETRQQCGFAFVRSAICRSP